MQNTFAHPDSLSTLHPVQGPWKLLYGTMAALPSKFRSDSAVGEGMREEREVGVFITLLQGHQAWLHP